MAKSTSPQLSSPAAVTTGATPARTTAERANRPGHFLRDVAIALVIAGAGLGLYYRSVKISSQVNIVAKHAKDLIEKDTPKDFYAAETQLQEALKLDSNNAYCLSALAEMNALLWGEDGVADRKAQAEDYTRRADAIDPHFAERYSADALVMVYNGQAPQAEASVRALVDKGARGGRIYDALGRALRAQGKLDDAKKAFTESTKAGRIPRFNIDLANLYRDQGDLLNADNFAQKAIESNPEHPGAQIARARIGIARGLNLKTATDDLASLLGPRRAELTPALLAEAYTARAELKLFNQQPAEALLDAQEAVKAYPQLAVAHQALGLAQLQSNNPSQAQVELERAQTLDPSVSSFYFDSAKALSAASQGDKAEAMLKKLPVKDERYHLAYGDLLARKGDQSGALTEYQEALKLNALSAQALYGEGLIFMAQKKYPDASKAFEAAYGAQPVYPEAHQQMGYVLLTDKKAEDAAGEFEQSLAQYVGSQTPHEKVVAMRDDFTSRLKKGAPKGLVAKFEDDAKQIVR